MKEHEKAIAIVVEVVKRVLVALSVENYATVRAQHGLYLSDEYVRRCWRTQSLRWHDGKFSVISYVRQRTLQRQRHGDTQVNNLLAKTRAI